MIEQIIFEVLFLRAVDVEPLRFPKKRHKQIKSNPAKILKKNKQTFKTKKNYKLRSKAKKSDETNKEFYLY